MGDTGVAFGAGRVVMLVWHGREVTGVVIFAVANLLAAAIWAVNRWWRF